MPLFIRMVNGVASVCAVGICVLRFALQNTEVSMHPGNMLEKKHHEGEKASGENAANRLTIC